MQKKLILSIAFMVVLLVLTVSYMATEPGRQAAAAQKEKSEALDKGTQLYAALCMACHGPQGEGATGMPLNLPVFREGSPDELAGSAQVLRETIQSGRPGTANPTLLPLPDGSVLSRTAMPAWSQQKGGPLTDQEVEDLVTFIQYGDWSKPASLAPKPKLEGQTPAPPSLSAEASAKGVDLFRSKGCVACHTLGSIGGKMGPDLTHIGNARDANFLQKWIKNPASVDRSNFIWSAGQKVPEGKTLMPTIPMTDAELKSLVDYLAALK